MPVRVRQWVYGRLAQMVEQLAFNQLVIGSIPIAPRRQTTMTYVVNEKCIKCKYTDCVDVCPVDCFVELEHMLVIDPEKCIDCALCVRECPVEAIASDLEKISQDWILYNKNQTPKGTPITFSKPPLETADRFAKEPNKRRFLDNF